MKLFSKDIKQSVAIIAEIGVNHEGDITTASKLLKMAADAGADAVKFQSFTPERFASSSDAERLQRVKGFALSKDDHYRLADEAKEHGVQFFSTAVTEDVVPFLAEIGSAIKIASGDLDFKPVIQAVAKSGKPILLSTGAGSIEEVDQAVGWIADEIGKERLKEQLVLMHCVSAYPTPLNEANVNAIPFMAERYNLLVGYSNHVIGVEACLAAVALGANVVEVHFTDCKSGREFRDHALSFDADDLSYLVQVLPKIHSSLGRKEKKVMPCEIANQPLIRKGVVAAKDIEDGTILAVDDLMYARPATEFTSSQLANLVGKTVNRSLKSGELIRRDDIKPPV